MYQHDLMFNQQLITLDFRAAKLSAGNNYIEIQRRQSSYRVSLKKVLQRCLSYFCSRSRILLFQMCYGIRISSPFHLGTQIISIHILNCPKIAKNACTDMVFGMHIHECGFRVMLFHKCVMFLHGCGMHYTSISKVCHFH